VINAYITSLIGGKAANTWNCHNKATTETHLKTEECIEALVFDTFVRSIKGCDFGHNCDQGCHCKIGCCYCLFKIVSWVNLWDKIDEKIWSFVGQAFIRSCRVISRKRSMENLCLLECPKWRIFLGEFALVFCTSFHPTHMLTKLDLRSIENRIILTRISYLVLSLLQKPITYLRIVYLQQCINYDALITMHKHEIRSCLYGEKKDPTSKLLYKSKFYIHITIPLRGMIFYDNRTL